MKSKLFQLGASEGFKKDVRLLVDIPDVAFNAFISFLKKITSFRHLPDADEFLPVSIKTGVSVENFRRILNLLLFLYRQETIHGDSIKLIIKDLQEDTIDEDQANELVAKLDKAQPFYEQRGREIIDIQYDLSMTFPTLEHIHTRCTSIARFKPKYIASKDDPDSYNPEYTGATPVILVQMDINSYGDSNCYSFALSEFEIDEFINRFELAKIQLGILSRHNKEGE